jgi:Gpi18-like mannosyltransferase
MIQAKAYWKNNNFLIVFAFFSFLFLASLIDDKAMGYDVSLFVKWAQAIKMNGISMIYHPENTVDYLPGFLYVLQIYTWFVNDINAIPQTIHFVKLVPLFFEILAVLLMCSFFKTKIQQTFYFYLGALNVAYFYNTMAWFQIDGWVASMMFFSVFAALNNRLFGSLVLFVLAVNIKFQAIIVLPVLGLYWLSQIKTFKQLLSAIMIVVISELLILSPFLVNGSASVVFQNVFNTYNLFPYVSLNARNFWMLIVENPRFLDDSNLLGFLPYKTWGLILFSVSSLCLIISLVMVLFKQGIKDKAKSQMLVLSSVLACFYFFYFNTQMHERYIHYAFPFVMYYSFRYKTLGLYLVFSIASFLNLESLLFNLNYWDANSILMSHRFITILFTIAVVLFSIKWVQLLKSTLTNKT